MDTVYKIIFLAGTSMESYEQAVKNAINRASMTLKGLSWFEVVEHRGKFRDDGTITPSQYRRLYRMANGGLFRSKAHLEAHMKEWDMIKEEK